MPIRLVLSAGQAHDNRAVPALLKDLPADSDVVADRAYDSRLVHDIILDAGARACVGWSRFLRKFTKRRLQAARAQVREHSR